MSTLFISGFFAVANARRSQLSRAGSEAKTSFIIYSTALQCISGQMVSADLRVYAKHSDPIFPDQTVVWVVAKAYLPSHKPANLDAIFCEAIPGDPSDVDSYDSSLPNFPFPFLFGVGNVPTASRTLPDQTRVWDVSTSQYVRDSIRFSTIQCAFDSKKPRWSNTHPPALHSSIHFVGVCTSVTPTGNVSISLEDITFNIGATATLPSESSNSPSSSPSSVKKRKFTAIIPSQSLDTSSLLQISPIPSPTDLGEGSSSNLIVIPPTIPSTPRKKPHARITTGSKPPVRKSPKGKEKAASPLPTESVDSSAALE